MRLSDVEAGLREIVAGLEPEALSAEAAAGLVDTFATIAKLADAGGALVARRVASSNFWRGAGERSAAHWLARRAGASISAALATLETAERVRELPALDAALRSGELSGVQAGEIASAASADPGAADELVRVARDGDATGLRERCRQVKAAAVPDEGARHRAIHASRSLRHWRDPDGAGRLEGRFTPEVLAELLVALEPFEAEAFRCARAEGRREGFDAYRADALVALARAGRDGSGGGAGARRPRHTVHVVIDHAALVRGEAEGGERCEVAGVGRVPVGVVRSLTADAFLTAVVRDGVDVSRVAHLGRHPTAHQRSALEVRDPECVVGHCHVRVGLEIDHVEPWSTSRITKLDALARLCRFHHAQKTHEGYRLEGGPGHWRWLKPDGSEVVPRPPPTGAPIGDDGTGTIAERQARICDAAIARLEGLAW